MAKLNKIICLLGESGSGKTTIANRLHEEYGYEILQSYTTRPPRYEGETGHTFINVPTYAALKNKVATDEYNGNFYAATKEQVDNADIYVINSNGLKQLRENYHGKPIVAIYVDVFMEERLSRMLDRGDSVDAAFERLKYDYTDFKNIRREVDHTVFNLDLDQTIIDMMDIINEDDVRRDYDVMDGNDDDEDDDSEDELWWD